MRENDLVVEEIALTVETDSLASVPETGIYGKYTLLPNRRGKQELLEILSEDLNRLDVRLLLGFLQDFIGDRGVQQTLPRILDGSTDLLR